MNVSAVQIRLGIDPIAVAVRAANIRQRTLDLEFLDPCLVSVEWRGERHWGAGDYVTPGSCRIRGVPDTRSELLRGPSVPVPLTAVR